MWYVYHQQVHFVTVDKCLTAELSDFPCIIAKKSGSHGYVRQLQIKSGKTKNTKLNYYTMTIFSVAIASIFGREMLEASIIIGQYRTVIKKSPHFKDQKEREMLQIISKSASIAFFFAMIVVLAVGIPLIILSEDLDDRVVEVVEGISKVVAAVCILQLSVKVPKWLGVYTRKNIELTQAQWFDVRSFKFNIMWNIWRETAECGVFLIPFFISGGAEAIPVSAIVGLVIGLSSGIIVYYSSKNMENKFWLTFFLCAVTGMLSVGLFVGGCHEFEEVWGETDKVWKIKNSFWSHKKFPMVMLKPFGYSSSRTILQTCCFWSWLGLLLVSHYYKYKKSRKMLKQVEKKEGDANDIISV